MRKINSQDYGLILTKDNFCDLHEEAGKPGVVDVLGQVLQQDG